MKVKLTEYNVHSFDSQSLKSLPDVNPSVSLYVCLGFGLKP